MATKLNKNMLEAIEIRLAHPGISCTEISRMMNLSKQTVWNWFQSDSFKEEYRRRVNEEWADAISTAQKQLVNLVNKGDFKAVTYILDSAGFNAPTKLQTEDSISINIVRDDE